MQIRSVMTSYCLQLKIVKCLINNISRNIKAVFLKLGTTIAHHKRNKMTPLEKQKNVNISETKEDITKRKTPFFCILKGLSNKQKLFFTS